MGENESERALALTACAKSSIYVSKETKKPRGDEKGEGGRGRGKGKGEGRRGKGEGEEGYPLFGQLAGQKSRLSTRNTLAFCS
jgi:hypothetical protein